MKKLVLAAVIALSTVACYRVCLNGSGSNDECDEIDAGRDGGARD